MIFALSTVITLFIRFGPPLMLHWCKLLPTISTLLADVNRIESTRLAWMNVDETEMYDILRGNIALLVGFRDPTMYTP